MVVLCCRVGCDNLIYPLGVHHFYMNLCLAVCLSQKLCISSPHVRFLGAHHLCMNLCVCVCHTKVVCFSIPTLVCFFAPSCVSPSPLCIPSL